MSKVQSPLVKSLHPHTIFRAFKYLIYCLLVINAFLFFQEDYLASLEVFASGVSLAHLAEAFSATIDTTAWIVLLLLFELETAVIPDEKLKGNLKWLLMAVRVVSYSFILWAFYGYLTKYMVMTDTVPFSIADVCSLVGTGFSWVQDLDEYPAIDQAACLAMQGQQLLQINGTEIIGTVDAVEAAVNLTIIDIINAGDWLLIVLMLEVEVYMQLKDMLTKRMLFLGKLIKSLLYAVLFFCAVYWGILGDFLDFWDAFLWLVAFIFIEMNIFQWHEETEEERAEEIETHDVDGGMPHAAE